MCGIAGWVDFGADPAVGGVAEAMTAAMAYRGPDDGGVWASGPVTLVHRRLAVIDIDGGRQPMVAHADDRVQAVITYGGEIYNFRELRDELTGYGHRFRTRSDTEVVLHAYLAWGVDFVHRLNGMFAFALWDVRREELLLVRDRFGVKPLYYVPIRNGVLFGSEPKAIFAHPLAGRTVDADGLRELFAGVKSPGASVLRGMPELRPGHVLQVGRNGIRDRAYWKLSSREHEHDLATTVQTVRDLLEDIVAGQLVSDVPLCTLLSGGLDSSTLTALAARAVGRQGERIRSFAVDFVDNIEHFQPDVTHPTPDGPYVGVAVEHIGSAHTSVVLDSARMSRREVRSAVVGALDWPVGIAGSTSVDISMYLLFAAIRQHSTVTLTGESADELFGGYPWFHHPLYTQLGTFPWTLAHNLGFPALFGPTLEALDVHGYQMQQYLDAVVEVPALAGESGEARRMREVTYFFLTRFMRTLLDRKDRLSMAVGLEVRVPYCDHRLMEYVFNVPWEMKVADGREKSLLRAAVSDLLPAALLERPKTGYPVSKDPAYDAVVRSEFMALLAGDESPVEPLLSQAVVRTVRAQPDAAALLTRTEMELALHLDEWMRMYDLRLDF